MKKILFVVHTLQVGGAEKVLLNILKNINKSKYDITVLAIVNDGIYVQDVKNIKGIKYKYVFNSLFKKARENKNSKKHNLAKRMMNKIWKVYLWLLKYFPSIMYRIFVREKYDVEIAFLEGKVAKFVSHSKNKKSKKIAWIHTDINNKPSCSIFRNLEEEIKCYKKFYKIICVSDEVKNRFSNKTGITENIYVQLNPIDSENILKKQDEKITEELNNKGLIVCSVGRLVKEKGYDRLLEVHNRLIKESIEHTLWIIGDGVKKDELEKYIEENNLKDTVNLVGYQKNPYKYIKKSDIFVCSSRVEGLSSVLLEAAIIGKPIVTTDCPGAKEILGDDGQSALIVENSTEGLYLGMKTILEDIELMRKFQVNIKKRSKLFNLQEAIKQIEKIIDE